MICEYNFTVEYYHTLAKACFDCPYNATDCDRPHCVAADGTKRGIITVNRMVPGPGIHVSNKMQNDPQKTFVICLCNHLKRFKFLNEG